MDRSNIIFDEACDEADEADETLVYGRLVCFEVVMKPNFCRYLGG